MTQQGDSDWSHDHEAIRHSHPHYHVTHNFRAMPGGFEHLTAEHDHEHDHAAISHSHFPHENFDSEHADEAHVHDHGEPVKADRAGKATKAAKATKATKASKAAQSG